MICPHNLKCIIPNLTRLPHNIEPSYISFSLGGRLWRAGRGYRGRHFQRKEFPGGLHGGGAPTQAAAAGCPQGPPTATAGAPQLLPLEDARVRRFIKRLRARGVHTCTLHHLDQT